MYRPPALGLTPLRAPGLDCLSAPGLARLRAPGQAALRLGASLVQGLTDALYPPRCLACQARIRAPGDLCDVCAEAFPGPVPRCRRCGRRTGEGSLSAFTRLGCLDCVGGLAVRDSLARRPGSDRRPPVVRGVVAASSYRATPRALVLALKFGRRPRAAELLGEGLADALARARWPGDLLVPVPLPGPRLRHRGYNQAELIARVLAGRRGIECAPRALRRRRDTLPQTGRSRAARRRGPAGAFAADPRLVSGRCVLLVDDVLTTGGTARACALALRRGGALQVELAVACRSEHGLR